MIAALIALLALAHQYALRVTAEDAFITFRYSRNLALGRGAVFNPRERVEGYSDFLWMVLLAGCRRWAGLDIPTAARALGAIASLVTLWVVYLLASGSAEGARSDVPTGLIAALLLGSSSGLAAWGSSGMEMSLFVLLCMSALLAAVRRSWLAAGLLAALATMTRPEGVLIAGPLAAWILWDTRPVRDGLRAVALGAAGYAIAVGPWVAWRVSYYGAWIPNTISAKMGLSPALQLKEGLAYLIEFVIANDSWLVLGAAVIAGGGAASASSTTGGPARTGRLAGLAAATFAFFAVLAGGDWMPAWLLLVPAVAATAVALAIAWSAAWRGGALRPGSRVAIALVALVAALQFGTSWSHPRILPFIERWTSMIDGLHDIGLWFHDSLPADTLIATHPNGALSYYSELPVIDMLGLTDRHIAVEGRKRKTHAIAGHVSFDYDYVARREPLLIFSSGEGFEKAPTTHYLREEFEAGYDPVCFRFKEGSNPLGPFVNLLLLKREEDRTTGLLTKDGRAEVVSCGPREPAAAPPVRARTTNP